MENIARLNPKKLMLPHCRVHENDFIDLPPWLLYAATRSVYIYDQEDNRLKVQMASRAKHEQVTWAMGVHKLFSDESIISEVAMSRSSEDERLHRRQVLMASTILAAQISAWRISTLSAAGITRTRREFDMNGATLSSIAYELRTGRIGAKEFALSTIAATESLACLNAYITFDAERLLEAARRADAVSSQKRLARPLHGVPIAIKDNIDVLGWRTTGGTAALRSYHPRASAPVMRDILAAGALVAGKTNLDELGGGEAGHNRIYGAINNPYRQGFLPGGSSGGVAAAVSARLVPAGLGTDTGGSARNPAALCGIVGYRPTTGSYPHGGTVSVSSTRSTPGPIARTVGDIRLFDAVIKGEPPSTSRAELRGLSIGVPRDFFWEHLDGETSRLCEDALTSLRNAGCRLLEAGIPDVAALSDTATFSIVFYELPRTLSKYLQDGATGVTYDELREKIADPLLASLLASIDKNPAATHASYLKALAARAELKRRFEQYFQGHGLSALVVPCTPLPARPITPDDTVEFEGKRIPALFIYGRNSDASANADLPAITVPIGLTRLGLPVGLEIQGPSGADRRILAIAEAIEELFRGKTPPPSPTCDAQSSPRRRHP
ncbi:MAG TPA: amidase family protein [Rhizomicrobium sp.]